jgi:hypothetical protein
MKILSNNKFEIFHFLNQSEFMFLKKSIIFTINKKKKLTKKSIYIYTKIIFYIIFSINKLSLDVE